MAVPETQLRRAAWALFWVALREEAPEVLEDLKGLLPLYREAAPAIKVLGVWSWASLERAAGTARVFREVPPHAIPSGWEPVVGRAGQALLHLREALLAWAGRWGLSGPEEPLDAGLQSLALWAADPGLPFGFALVEGVVDKAGPGLEIPPFDPLAEDWAAFEARARERFEAWLRAYRDWAQLQAERPELAVHARWLAFRKRGLSYRQIADGAREPVGEDAVRHGVVRLAKLLGLRM